MKLVRTASAASAVEVTVEDTDIIAWQLDDNHKPAYKGTLITSGSQAQNVFGCRVFHGTNTAFTSFKGKNHFFTGDLRGAVAFAELSTNFRPTTTKDGFRIYACKLTAKHVLSADKKQHASLFNKSVSPSDGGCQDFLRDHPEYDAIHFNAKDFSDAGFSDVWFLANPKLIKVVSIHRLFLIDVKVVPSHWPKRLQKHNAWTWDVKEYENDR